MKNLICILSIVILCMAASVLFAAEATLTVEGEAHLATTSGKVGIGTTRPTQELTIETTGVNNPGIALVQNQAGVDGDILFYEGSALSSSLRFHNAGGLEFIDRSPSVVSRFLINSSGNVGIGTTSPQQKLHVNGNVRAKGFITGDITFTDKASGQPLWRMYEDAKGLYLESSETGEIYRIMLEKIK